jgi:putative glutamine amidotransferase
MPRAPLIGITTEPPQVSGDRRDRSMTLYAQAVASAGGVPVILPFVDDPSPYAETLDGWLIAGGPDIPSSEYGEEEAPELKPISETRYQFEKALWPAFVASGKPILGICYGCQFISVRFGGSLVQHLNEGLEMHRGEPGTYPPHPVLLDEASRVAQACGLSEFLAPSSHHQAVNRVGKGLRVSGRAPDGVIEAVEADDGRWILGVQWHPERAPEDPATRALFASFVRACALAGR